MKKYKRVLFIGRFQPVHRAHVEIIKRAQALADQVIVAVGSSRQPRTYKNPFTFDERVQMLVSSLDDSSNIRFYPIIDYNDDNRWALQVQELMNHEIAHAEMLDNETITDDDIAIIGHTKDASSFYLEMFKQWKLVEVEQLEPLNATDVRDLYFREDVNLSFLREVIPTNALRYLEHFQNTEEYRQIIRERRHIEQYKLQYKHLPYEPVFVTTDAVVFHCGQVLMVKRRSEPGKGLWALPGGFLNAGTDRSLEDAMLRELKEETNIKVPLPVLRGSIKRSQVFDSLNRSARGRTITHAYNILLQDGPQPKVRGADDAEVAKWVPLASVQPEECFEDHYQIIQSFING